RQHARLPAGERLRGAVLVAAERHRPAHPPLDVRRGAGLVLRRPVRLRALLAVLTPERLAGIFTPILDAVRARINALIDLVVAPVQQTITDVNSIVNAFDLKPLKDGLEAVYQQL